MTTDNDGQEIEWRRITIASSFPSKKNQNKKM
jgi:hypothetical protein